MSSSSVTAFASPLALTSVRSTFQGSVSKTVRRTAQPNRRTTRAALPDNRIAGISRAEEDRIAKKESEYRGPQGFTPYAERVNGRIAQLGFVIGLITEIVSGKPIGEQIVYMFSPLTHLATSFVALGANAHIDKLFL